MERRVAGRIVLVALALGGCTSFGSAHEQDDASSAEGNAGDVIVAPSRESDGADGRPDAAGDTPENFISNPGFESGNCDGWIAIGGSADIDPVARSGSFSCRVCATSTAGVQFLTAATTAPPKFGDTYRFRGHVRAVPDAVVRNTWSGVLQSDPAGDNRYGSGVQPIDTWQEMQVTYTVGSDAGVSLLAYFLTNDSGTVGRCVLVDDARLERLQ
jgi:hypothetical protein